MYRVEEGKRGTALVVQWLRLLANKAGGMVLIPGPGTRDQATRVRSLGREDPLEKEMAPHSSILAWKIP